MNVKEAKICVGTYKKYSNGLSFCKWLTLADYNNHSDFLKACQELHKDERPEEIELMFQDYDNIPNSFINESHISGNFFELRNAIQDWDSERAEAFWDFWNEFQYDIEDKDIKDIISHFETAWYGSFESEDDFAYYYIENGFTEELTKFALSYFDYKKYSEYLFSVGFSLINNNVFDKNIIL